MQTHKCRVQWNFKNGRQACNRHPDQETEHLAKWAQAEVPGCYRIPSS